jgi:hypothetical protein
MAHRLSGLSARKRLDGATRSTFISAIKGVQSEVGALRKSPCS